MSLIKAIMGICETKPLVETLWSVEDDKIKVNLSQMAEPLPRGGAVYLKGKGLSRPIFLFRTEDDRYLAFQNRCSHIGHRRLDPAPGENKIRCCSVFHSTYDLEGNPVSGPARQQLKKYHVQQAEGNLVIDIQ